MATVSIARERAGAVRPWGVLPLLGVAPPSHHAFRVWQRNRDAFLRLWRVNLFPPLFEPVVMILAMGLGLGAFVELADGVDYIQFVSPGVLAVFPVFAAIEAALWSAFFRFEQGGIYAAMLTTPARAEDIAAGEILWAATRTTFSAVLILVVMAMFTPAYDLIESPLVILAIPVAFLVGLLFAGFSLAYTSRALSIHQLMYFFTLVITPMFWFSGVFFPLDELPDWVSIVAWFLPMTHAVDLFRGLTTGDLAWSHGGDLLWLAVVTIPACWLALWSVRRRLVN
ncbi:MAG: ABC transporter permease [Dehalococcoidia bacterium]